MDSLAIADMLERGLIRPVGADGLEDFLDADGLCVLFFTGGKSRRGDAHDVAVALREIIRDYRGAVRAGLLDPEDEAGLQSRFRVLVSPSLVLVHGGATLEVIPGVRDWADYARAFQRYLGNPGSRAGAENH